MFNSFNGVLAENSARDGDREIFIMDIDGSNQTRLTNNNGRDDNITFSPDGLTIAFTSLRDGYLEICKINISNYDLVNLTQTIGSDQYPVYSPDGSKIVFTSTRAGGSQNIYLMNSDGSNQIRMTDSDRWNDELPIFSQWWGFTVTQGNTWAQVSFNGSTLCTFGFFPQEEIGK